MGFQRVVMLAWARRKVAGGGKAMGKLAATWDPKYGCWKQISNAVIL